ncbi:DUF6491 family protein [Dyella acidiphila]|uniref:Lipoprotein n=1 Tax=Dyella acidiphila TaxID=2775866 RepID=A0ABR9G5H9_9GAMM|nr:DUF6491 family protein [Dyella acidiphila]MBE1159268.1 hypothetical protein [Dyella acidiphila]
MPVLRVSTIMLLALGLSACVSEPSTPSLPQQQRQEAYNAAAGDQVQHFHLVLHDIYSWERLSDTQVVVYTQPTRAYLLDVWPCSSLNYTNSIGLTSSANQVAVGADKVIVSHSHLACKIEEIRPVDLAQFKLDKASQRHIDNLQRDSDASKPAA